MTPTVPAAASSAELGRGVTYADLIVRALHRHSERVCFITDGGIELTYAEIRDRVYRTARALDREGIRRGEGIALLSRNRPEAFVVQAAALILGCRFTPLHPLGSAEDHRFILEDSETVALVTDASIAGQGHALEQASPSLRRILALGGEERSRDLISLADRERPSPVAPQPDPEDISWLLYTGGTTGRPKGVMVSHRSMAYMTQIMLAEWDFPDPTRFLVLTPMSHAAGVQVLTALLRGGTAIIRDRFDPEQTSEDVRRHAVTMTFMVPSMVYAMLDHVQSRPEPLAGLQTLVYGAAPMSPARLGEGLEVLGPVFFQLYGQAEVPTTVCVMRRQDHLRGGPARLAACGRPVDWVHVRLQTESADDAPDGEVGEIVVRGPLAMSGYWKRPEETAMTLRDGWVHTGDLARRDGEGFLYIVDRLKDMIVSGGFNVFPREVEDVLTAHPAVARAAVIGIPDDRWGEAVHALVVLRDGATVTGDQLAALVRESKGPVQAPKRVEIVRELPLTALGKPDKKLIRAQYWAGQERAVH